MNEPLGTGADGEPVYLRDLWPSQEEVGKVVASVIDDRDVPHPLRGDVFDGDERWRALPAPTGDRYAWDPASTYIRKPPFLEGIGRERRRSPTWRAPGCSPCSATA
ncbi:MAG: hypothetical protein KatS3mg009_1482 [Acidimicrobiia bacterium]|nr:MAG: hypothetical protein KatS3mg009_1482 [Acidimicrobiia bacterium]